MSRIGSPHENLLTTAVEGVFGPGRPVVSWIVIVVAGVVGWLAGVRADVTEPTAREWLRPWACAGYGVAAGALLTLLPRVLRISSLHSTLSRRPAGNASGQVDRPWWPLQLLTAALRNTPLLRITEHDFTAAAAALVPEVRGLLAHRLWPASAAAFTAPVLGLVSAWWTWGHYINAVERQAMDGAAVPFGTVAWPMMLTILAGLAVMLAVVVVDQLTRGLLQRWSTNVRFEDVEAPVVKAGLTAIAEAAPPVVSGADPVPPRAGPAPPVRASEPPPAPVDIEGLKKMFGHG